MKIYYFSVYIALLIILFPTFSLSASNETVRIGVTLSLTGKFSVMGNDQKNGYKLWQNHINSRGGLLGRKVEVLVYDDKSDPETAKAIYEQMIINEKVDFLFGPYSSPITEAVLPLAEQHNHPLLIAGASADSLWEKKYRTAIGVATPSSRFSQGFLELLVRNKINKIAIVHADDSFSVSLAKGVISWSGKLGLEVIMSESFKKDTRDLIHLAKKVRDSGAEALVVGGHLNEAVDMRKALKLIGYYPKAYYAVVGADLNEYIQILGNDANYTFSISIYEPNLNFPGIKKFHSDYIKTYKKMPSFYAARAYSAGQVLEESVKRSNSFDRKKVLNTFFKMDMITILGRYGIDRTGKQIRHHVSIIQWQKGKKEIVWPEKLATAKPIFNIRRVKITAGD